jgi:hypothetical protein
MSVQEYGLDSSGLELGPVASYFEHDDELSGSLTVGAFLDRLNNDDFTVRGCLSHLSVLPNSHEYAEVM